MSNPAGSEGSPDCFARIETRSGCGDAARSGSQDDLVLAVSLAVWSCQSLSPLSARNQTFARKLLDVCC